MPKEQIFGFDHPTAQTIIEKVALVRRETGRTFDPYEANGDDTFWVEITDSAEGSGGIFKHASKLKRRSGETWEDISTGSGSTTAILGTTDTGYVVMPDGSQLANGTIVCVKITPVTGGSNTTTRSYTVVGGSGGSLPTGQYQYMVYQMTTQNGAGFDYMRAHPITEG